MKILLLNKAFLRLEEYLLLGGFQITYDINDDFDFILPAFDTSIEIVNKISKDKNKFYPDVDFIDKSKLENKCVASGIGVLPTMKLSELSDCTYDNFIIKPKIWSGGKSPVPWVYKIFPNSQIANIIAMISESSENINKYFVQKALLNTTTNETYLLFVDGVVNGSGEVHFNAIADKYMLNSTDNPITHKMGIRRVSSADKFGFKQKITKLLQDNNIRNTPFKVQAIVDIENNTCYINDWSWGIMPYTHLYVLDHTYLKSHLEFAYDISPTVTKPIDKIIVMHHISFPADTYTLSEEDFDLKYGQLSTNLGVKRVENIKQFGSSQPQTTHFILYGIGADTEEDGLNKLNTFQTQVTELG